MKTLCLIAFIGCISLFAFEELNCEPHQDDKKMKIEIQFPKEHYVVSENVSPQIRILNEGTEPVQIPDPFHINCWQLRYILKRLGADNENEFSFRSSEIGDFRAAPEEVPLSLITLAPGESIEDSIPLSDWQEIVEPGNYRLSAWLEWQGETLRSSETEFTIEPLRAHAVSVGIECGTESDHARIAIIHKGDKEVVLFGGIFTENRPDLGEFDQTVLHRITELEADANNVLCAWTNFARSQTLVEWRAWSGRENWFARSSSAKTAQRVELDQPCSLVARPALHTRVGNMDIFVVSGDGKDLLWLRFPPNQRVRLDEPLWSGPEKPGEIFKRAPLPTKPLQARAALSSESSGSQRHIAFLFQEEKGLSVGHIAYTAEGQPSELRTVPLPGAKPLSQSELGLYVDEDGTAHLSALIWNDQEKREIALVDAQFPAKGEPAKLIINRLGQYEKSPIASVVSYRSIPLTAKYPMKRDWAILFEDRHLLSSIRPEEPRPISMMPAIPMELLVRSQAVYLLVLDPKKGYEWQALY